jgi:glycosyltransferase involved in cell wall biosynthesis
MLENKRILLMSPVTKDHSPDGYSNAAWNMFQIIEKLQQEATIKSIDQIDLNKLQEYPVPITFYDIIILIINPFMLINDFSQKILHPYFKRGKKVFLQIVWETDPLPSSWKAIWDSDLITGFIAPSHFIEGLIKKETKKPVYYVPHYVDTSLFKRIDLNTKLREKVFTVLCAGQWTERKGHRDAIISFARALASNSDCRLIVKYNRVANDPADVESETKKMIIMNTQVMNSPILACGNSISKEELVDLYHQTSVLLYPSRGEGFGFFPTEITSVGIPIIYTDWSSTSEVAKAPGNIPVKFYLDECMGMAQFGYEKGSRYAIPYMYDLMGALEYKYQLWKNNREFYYNETINNYKIIDEKYGIQAVKNAFIKFFEDSIEE